MPRHISRRAADPITYSSIQQSGVWSYTSYPYPDSGMVPYTYLNNRIVAEEARDSSRSFWGIALAAEHRNVKPGTADSIHSGALDYQRLDGPTLRIMAFRPPAYGAKGIVWWGYRLPRSRQRIRDAHGTALGDSIGRINSEVANMSAALSDLRWSETIHSDSVNNERTWWFVGKTQPDRAGLPEAGLPTVDSSLLVDSLVGGRFFAAGILDSNSSTYPYFLLVLNKDRSNPRQVRIQLNELYHISRHAKTAPNAWNPVNPTLLTAARKTRLSMTIAPGDVEFLRLEGPRVSALLAESRTPRGRMRSY